MYAWHTVNPKTTFKMSKCCQKSKAVVILAILINFMYFLITTALKKQLEIFKKYFPSIDKLLFQKLYFSTALRKYENNLKKYSSPIQTTVVLRNF